MWNARQGRERGRHARGMRVLGSETDGEHLEGEREGDTET